MTAVIPAAPLKSMTASLIISQSGASPFNWANILIKTGPRHDSKNSILHSLGCLKSGKFLFVLRDSRYSRVLHYHGVVTTVSYQSRAFLRDCEELSWDCQETGMRMTRDGA